MSTTPARHRPAEDRWAKRRHSTRAPAAQSAARPRPSRSPRRSQTRRSSGNSTERLCRVHLAGAYNALAKGSHSFQVGTTDTAETATPRRSRDLERRDDLADRDGRLARRGSERGIGRANVQATFSEAVDSRERHDEHLHARTARGRDAGLRRRQVRLCDEDGDARREQRPRARDRVDGNRHDRRQGSSAEPDDHTENVVVHHGRDRE